MLDWSAQDTGPQAGQAKDWKIRGNCRDLTEHHLIDYHISGRFNRIMSMQLHTLEVSLQAFLTSGNAHGSSVGVIHC